MDDTSGSMTHMAGSWLVRRIRAGGLKGMRFNERNPLYI
jgi:hypothetical protein